MYMRSAIYLFILVYSVILSAQQDVKETGDSYAPARPDFVRRDRVYDKVADRMRKTSIDSNYNATESTPSKSSPLDSTEERSDAAHDASAEESRAGGPISQPITAEKKTVEIKRGDSLYSFSLFFWPEFFYAKNITLLNNANPDEFFYFRSFLDLTGTYSYGQETYKTECVKARGCLRSRTYWRDQMGVLLSTEQPIKDVDIVFGDHRHGLFLSDMWIRELWIEVALNDLMNLPWCKRHLLTIGSFSFELGRGISLGYNYPLMPTFVGFFTEVYVDQYAWGAKLVGELSKDHLYYSLYGSIFHNLSASFDQTNERVRSSEYGRRFDAARGFGVINYLGAARLQWYPFGKSETKQLYLEPYILYNWNPIIRVDPRGHGASRLITYGLMGEYTGENYEWGFEFGFNRGGQQVFGVDRNSLVLQDREGVVVFANDEVVDSTTGFDALVTPLNQNIIDNSARTSFQNGKPIGSGLINERHRFQDPYLVRYRGLFFVVDGSYIFKKDMLKVSAALGIATGDRDPRLKALYLPPGENRVIDYDGFIAINETYAGKRVTSSLFFNGFGSFPRVFDFGIIDLPENAPILNATGFTNLIYAGVSLDYQYKNNFHHWHINPNILFFWHETPACRFEPLKELNVLNVNEIQVAINDQKSRLASNATQAVLNQVRTPRLLSPFLGAELNMLAEIELYKDLTFFSLAAIFIPGFHYKQMKGFPMPSDHKSFVRTKQPIRTSVFGDDTGYLLNVGFKFMF